MASRFKVSTNANYSYSWNLLQKFLDARFPGAPSARSQWSPYSEPNREHAWCSFLLWLRRSKLRGGAEVSYETARKCFPAINAHFQAMGFPPIPFDSFTLLHNIKKAWKNSSVKAPPKAGVTLSRLTDLICNLGASYPLFCAISIFCWYGLARLGEVLHKITWRDLTTHKQHVSFFLRESKCGHHKFGAFIHVPISAWNAILDLLDCTKHPRKLTDPIFPASRSAFVTWLKGAIPGHTGHSFRRGGAQWLFDAGVPLDTIQRIGRWRSNAWELYINTAARDASISSAAAEAGMPVVENVIQYIHAIQYPNV